MGCGAACVASIVKYAGGNISPLDVGYECLPTHEGVSLQSISRCLRSYGFKTCGGAVFPESLEKLEFPAILHWEQNHFVVLFKVRKKRNGRKYYIGDPACGLLKMNEEQFTEKWCSMQRDGEDRKRGIILLVSKGDFDGKRTGGHRAPSTFRQIQGQVKYNRGIFLKLAACMAFLIALQSVMPYLTKSVIDVGVNTGDRSQLLLILLSQAAILLGMMTFRMFNSRLSLYASTHVNISIVSGFLEKLTKLPMSFFENQMCGDMIERIHDHSKIEDFIVNQLVGMLHAVVSALVYGVLLFSYDYMCFLCFLTGGILTFLWSCFTIEKKKVVNHELFKQGAANNSVTYQLITGMQEAKLQGSTKRRCEEWCTTKRKYYKALMSSLSLSQKQEIGNLFISQSVNLVITYLTVSSVISGEITLGTMTAIQYVLGQLTIPVSSLLGFFLKLQDVRISMGRVSEINAIDDEDSHSGARQDAPSDIVIRNLSFRYQGSEKTVLEDIDMTVPQGKVTAIVGSSGSGKTTLLKLMLLYYDSYQGTIETGGIDFRNLNHEDWRRQVGVVMQDSFVFTESIARNIAASDKEPDMERVRFSARMACLDSFIETLPLKYHTIIGADGRSLSQGQKQRLFIARAVYRNAPVLFLDEATNSLDAQNERMIVENLNTFFKGRTVVVVAHRLSTVKHAHQIIVLDRGRVVETGNHETLTARHGAYYNLVKNQLELGG